MNILSQCETSNTACISAISLSLYALLILIFAFFAGKRIYQVNQVTLELIPIVFCVIQSLLHIIQYLFVESNKLQIITMYVQVLIFAFIASIFVNLCHQIKQLTLPCLKIKCFFYFDITFYGTMLILQCIMVILAQNNSCDIFYLISMLLIIIQLLITSMQVFYFGWRLLEMIERVSKIIKFKTMRPNSVIDQIRLSTVEPVQLKERKSQIKTLLLMLLITLLLYVFFIIVINVFFSDITCNHAKKTYAYENITWIFFGIIQMTPCLVIPYVFGYIPKTDFNSLSQDDQIVFQSQFDRDTMPYLTTLM